MLQNPCKTLGFKKNMVYVLLLGGGKSYPASGLFGLDFTNNVQHGGFLAYATQCNASSLRNNQIKTTREETKKT